MDNINTNETVKKIPAAAGIILGFLAALSMALIPTAAGGFIMLMLAVSFEGLLLIAEPSFAAFLPIPVSFAAAVIMTGDPVISLCALLAVPGAFCLRICFAKKCSLSVTLSALSVCFIFSYGIFVAAGLITAYGSVSAGIADLKAQFSEGMAKTAEAINALAKAQLPDGDAFLFTDETLYAVKKLMLMLSPALFVVGCELAAYVSEKLMRLFSRIFRCSFVADRKEKVTLSVGFAVIFIISYFLSSVIAGDNVLYFCAESLMLIVLPYACVAGIHSMLGEGGLFRTPGKTGFKVVTAILCFLVFLSSPVMLFALLALWGSMAVIGRAVFRKMLELRDESEDDNDGDDGDDGER